MQRQIDLFLKFMATEKERSENTIAAYRNDLGQFQSFINSRQPKSSKVQPQWSEVSPDDVSAFVEYLINDLTLSPTTAARKVAAIKSIFRHLQENDNITSDPASDVKSPKVQKSPPKSISYKEIVLLLQEPAKDTTPKGLRDKAILEMLYATGMRVTELINLNVSSVDLDQRTVLCAKDGKRERTVQFSQEVAEYLGKYLERGREIMVIHPDEKSLFLNHRGRRLTRQGLWLIIKGYVEAVGIEEAVTPHTLRHSFAAHMLNSGAELKELQQRLGHASITTTQVYRQENADTPSDSSAIIIDGKPVEE